MNAKATRTEFTRLSRLLERAESVLDAIRVLVLEGILHPACGRAAEAGPSSVPVNFPLATHQPTKAKTP